MSFSEVLNRYIDQIGCTGSELAQQSGISASTFSRYRSGFRVPAEDSPMLDSLSEGIEQMLLVKNAQDSKVEENAAAITKDKIKEDLLCGLHGENNYVNHQGLGEKIDSLIKTLSISPSQLSLFLKMDLSSLYRIRKGTRKTRTPEWLTHSVAEYLYKNKSSTAERERLEELTGRSLRCADYKTFIKETEDWLGGKGEDRDTMSTTILESIDSIDLNEMLRYQVRDFSKEKEAASKKRSGSAKEQGLSLRRFSARPISKHYAGPKEMVEGLKEFLKKAGKDEATFEKELPDFPGKEKLTGVRGRDVIIYTEFSIVMGADRQGLAHQIVSSGAKIIQSGRTVHLIFAQSGNWKQQWTVMKYMVPLFLSGGLKIYFVEGKKQSPLQHLMLCSASSFFYAEMIDDDIETLRSSLWRNTKETEFGPIRMRRLLACAEKIGDVFPKEKMPEFFRVARERVLFDRAKDRRYTVLTTVPPLWTISEDLLERILADNHVEEALAQKIRLYRELDRFYYAKMIERGGLKQGIGMLNEKEFKKYPLSLSLSNVYMDETIVYSYEQYLEHWEQTKKAGRETEGYQVYQISEPFFRNIRIVHQHGKDGMQLLSRNNVPCVHLLISHPELLTIGEEIMNGMIEEEKRV